MKIEKVLAVANGSPWLFVTYQKSNLTLVGAVAFLMFFYKKNYRSHSTDNADNSIYYRDNDTNDTYKLK